MIASPPSELSAPELSAPESLATSESAVDAVARALADGTRRQLLRLVRDSERSAGELAAQFPSISRPAVSQHLRVLHDAGLVTVRPAGARRLYAADATALAPVSRFIDEMWSDRLRRLKAAAESAESAERSRR